MDSAPLSKTSLRWIRRPVLSSFSVEEDGTGSKLQIPLERYAYSEISGTFILI